MNCDLGKICNYAKDKIAVSDLNLDTYISTENMLPNKQGITRSSALPKTKQTQAFFKGDVLISNIRPYFKKIWLANFDGGCSNDVLVLRANQDIDNRFLFYVLSNDSFFDYATATAKGTKMPRGDKTAIFKYQVPVLDLNKQKRIAAILSALDDKIEINRKINENLEQQAQALYQQIFVETQNEQRYVCRADDCFDISIGKTPPRKESQWFSTNSSDYVWVSISDMGNCGLYIADSSEYLTKEAVDKFNIKLVPDNTVILSFKLTVGRVAITDGEMVTNEAIAHFKTDKKNINEYLYCYLRNFNFQTMGSTSSIATAVNSKIVKGMPFTVPADKELAIFHSFATPLFALIKYNLQENVKLFRLRDMLLPKLMSGELDVSDIDL